ncbi:MAG: aminodeoxychorismate synthase component I [Flavobacteriaceae bacterium]
MRTIFSKTLENTNAWKHKLLLWSQKFTHVICLDSNEYPQETSEFDFLIAVGSHSEIKITNDLEQLKTYQTLTKDWLFGYLSYDLKNNIENLESKNFDGLDFPDVFFFQPKKIFFIKGNSLEVSYLSSYESEIEADLKTIGEMDSSLGTPKQDPIKIKLRIHKDDYFKKVARLLEHIHIGDVYEINFCQEFYSEETQIAPVETYFKLNEISKPPFAAFLKLDDSYLLSASPERYLKKSGSKVSSQPIKGTAKRAANEVDDMLLKEALANDMKEQSENIMIVDLVRNDLSRVALKGSVKVDELCKVYTFEQVHQLISTITCEVETKIHPVDIIRATFPMGSMTGAPKISAMKLIETYEETKRGLYSGAVGYFTPNGDFDFNVVIRSILYNEKNKYVSYSVGGAITAKSDPVKEYEECLVKAKAMREVLEG